MFDTSHFFSDLYDYVFIVLQWVSDFLRVMQEPMSEWVEIDFGDLGELPIIGAIEDALNYVLDLFTTSRFGDATILEFCFGSGLTLILALAIVRMFLSARR